MDSVLLWLKKQNKPNPHHNLWMVICSIMVLITLLVSGGTVSTVYANPSVQSANSTTTTQTISPSSSSFTTSPNIIQAITQAQGRVLIHGFTPPLLLDALIKLEHTNPDVNVNILYPITTAELQQHQHIITSLNTITARSAPWTIFFTQQQPQSSSARWQACTFDLTELYALIDRTVYRARYITSTANSDHQTLKLFYHSTQFTSQQQFLTRFLTCRAQHAAYSIQPYTYQTSSQLRPKNLASQLPKIPKWLPAMKPNQVPHSTQNPSSHSPRFRRSPHQHSPPYLSPSHNPWHHGRHNENVLPYSSAHQPPETPQQSSSNLWYNRIDHDRATP